MGNQFLINLLLMLVQLINPDNKMSGGLMGLITKVFGMEEFRLRKNRHIRYPTIFTTGAPLGPFTLAARIRQDVDPDMTLQIR